MRSPLLQLSITLARGGIARLLWLAGVGAGVSGCADTAAPAGGLKVVAVDVTDGQAEVAGNTLPRPLSVQVALDGAVKAGAVVNWQVSAGTIVPASGVTDAAGTASASWTLGAAAGEMSATATVNLAEGSPVTFHATALPPPTRAVVIESSNGQTGAVGTTLPQPLRVQVDSNGAPKAGVSIHWRTGSGSVSPETSVSDEQGVASTTWTLGTVSGVRSADATVDGSTTSQAFSAKVLPGPAAAIDRIAGTDHQTSPSNHGPFAPLIAIVTDQYGNAVTGQAVAWSISSGPVEIVTVDDTTDARGMNAAVLRPTGTPGHAVVRAVIPGVAGGADFDLTISLPTYGVVLHTPGLLTYGPFAFISSQNGSTNPAVDTMAVGQTMIWTQEFDYNQHGVKSVGSPSFEGGDFPYTGNPSVSVKFDTPGTYAYHDPYWPAVTGIVVVQ